MYWIRFNEWCAQHSARGSVRELAGTRAVWSHTILIVNNLSAVTGLVRDDAELAECAQAAVVDADQYGLPWMFGAPEPWLPGSVEQANAVLAPCGLRYQMYMTVMECDGPLAAPVRPLPEAVTVKRVDSPETAFDALNLNSESYGMPKAVTEDVIAANVYFSDPERDFGFVVYDAQGLAVSTATAIDLGDCVYLAAVATHPGHRRQGYAEVAMRAALAAAPKKKTALDASRMGEPLYAQMGYQRRFKWHFWVKA
jgi:GNAT superfamily N-acetyltransferase